MLAPHLSESERFAGLDRDLPEIEPTFGLHGRLEVVFLADRHAAATDDQVVATRGAAQRLAGGGEVVGNDAEIVAPAAERLDQAAQGEPVRVVDRARLERLAGHR